MVYRWKVKISNLPKNGEVHKGRKSSEGKLTKNFWHRRGNNVTQNKREFLSTYTEDTWLRNRENVVLD